MDLVNFENLLKMIIRRAIRTLWGIVLIAFGISVFNIGGIVLIILGILVSVSAITGSCPTFLSKKSNCSISKV